MRAASERPAPGDAIAPFDARRGPDSTGGCSNEGSPIGKPIARDGLAGITADAAHAAAIADEPTDRAVERRSGFNDAHELEWRELGPADRLGQPQPEQPGSSQRLEYVVRQSS